jgi:cytochrome c551/c552
VTRTADGADDDDRSSPGPDAVGEAAASGALGHLVVAGLAVAVLGALTLVAWWPRDGDAVPSATATASGAQLFLAKGCVGCHEAPGHRGTISVGPALTGLRERAGGRVPGLGADAYVRQSVRQPQAYVVPGFEDGSVRMPTLAVSDAELDALVDYLLGPSP